MTRQTQVRAERFVRPIRWFAVVAFLAVPIAAPVRAQLGTLGSRIFQQGAGGIPGAAAELDRFGTALATGDFDGDGFADLAVGTPRESVPPTAQAGTVTVIPGSVAGLDGNGSVLWDLNGVAGQNAGTGDGFGRALAAGDFDGDGYADLAIGIPWRDVVAPGPTIEPESGAVVVLYGGPGGLDEAVSQYWRQGSGGVDGALEEDDFFGAVLAAGDFDGDGIDDLAIGVPGEDVGDLDNAGAVNVIYGSPAGLATGGLATADAIFTQGSLGSSSDEASDLFGSALASGDFDDDGFDDLAISAPREDWIDTIDAGAVFVMLGSSAGLTTAGDQILAQDLPGLPDDSEEGDVFGTSLAAGDFDGDGIDDLAIGSPGEQFDLPPGGDVGSEMGVVHVVPGVSGLGLSSVALAVLDRAALGQTPTAGDRFGASLAAAAVGGAGPIELLVGAPGVEVAGADMAGVVHVVSFPNLGLAQVWSQDGAVPGVPELGDGFGDVLAAGDFDGNGFADAAIGVPFEDVGDLLDGGAVNILPSVGLFRDGFESAGPTRWSSTIP